MAAGSLEGEERGNRSGEVGGEVESEGDGGGGPAMGKAFDLSLITGRSPCVQDARFTTKTLNTCGVLRRLHWRSGQVKVGVRLLLQSSRALLEIIPPVMRVSVRGALWRAIHRVAVVEGRRSGKESRREPVEGREKGRRRNPTGGQRGTKMPKQAANHVGK